MHRLAVIAPLVLASAAAAREPAFYLIGLAPGTTTGGVGGLSLDGSFAVGGCAGGEINPGFTWTALGGRYDFGLEAGMPEGTPAHGVSSDGGVLVGNIKKKVYTNPPEYYFERRAYRRIGAGPVEDLGVLPKQTRSYATGVSGDAQVIVGRCEHGEFTDAYGEAFRWTEQDGMQGLGFLKPNGTYSKAYGISRDGTTIVGMSQSDGLFGDKEAFAWTEADGMQELKGLAGAPFVHSEALAVSGDGSVIVGKSPGPDLYTHAVRWVDGQLEDLSPDFGHSAIAHAVSDSGDVVGGEYDSVPFVWTAHTGLIDLVDYLAAFGVAIPDDYQLTNLRAISGDGLTFAGAAKNLFTNKKEGFVATISAGCDADCDASGELDIDDFICFQTLFGLGDAGADCDNSGELDIDDFVCFQTAFAVGCR